MPKNIVHIYNDSYNTVYYTLELGYEPNGGRNAPGNVQRTISSSAQVSYINITISNNSPNRTGYKFIGWNTKDDGTGETYSSGSSISYAFGRKEISSYVETSREEDTDTIYIIHTTYHVASDSTAYKTLYAIWEVSVSEPYFSNQPSSISVFTNGSAILSCSAKTENGTLSYQWQSSADKITWSNIEGATATNYTAPTSVNGKTYYRVIATATQNEESLSTTSTEVYVEVHGLSSPSITVQPSSATYGVGDSAKTLKVVASSNGTLSYRWQTSPDNSTWDNIPNATLSTYTPPTSSAGTSYYRCVVTSTGGSETKSTTSKAAKILVAVATQPSFEKNLSTIDKTYNAGDIANKLDGRASAPNGTLSYQWQKSNNNGTNWFDIIGATSAYYEPSTSTGGVFYYRVVCTNKVGTSSATATSGNAIIRVINAILSFEGRWAEYLSSIGKPFIKLARLDFLNPNGSVLFSLDNNPNNPRSNAFIQSGELSVNMQNGPRRIATVTLSNLDGQYSYNVNKLWFGQQVRLWEGMKLPNGQDFYISQGVFYVKDPEESFDPGLKQATLHLVDKWAYLDGSLFGNLDGTYEVPVNSNIFNVIQSILNFDRGNGEKIDSSPPVFTSFYNGKTTTLPNGSTVSITNTPYTYRCDSENGTYADVILEMNTMLAGWVGYDSNGQLRLDPSQDDILDQTKPVQWEFTPKNSTFLGATYSVKNSEVYNDIIVIGESLSEYGQTAGRATNYDPRSDTNANLIGLKTKRYSQSGYYTQDICESLAVFKLKRESVLKKSVTIETTQMFHLQENNLVTIQRTDKPGNPVERHLIMGYTRPIAQNGVMSINACSVMDWPVATITQAP